MSGDSGVCPVCSRQIDVDKLNIHVNNCLNMSQCEGIIKRKSSELEFAKTKKPRVVADVFTRSLTSNRNSYGAVDDKSKTLKQDSNITMNRNDQGSSKTKSNTVPLAESMRPSNLDDFIGQEQAIGPNSLLCSLVNKGKVPSLIVWGPPGCGKTTLIRIIANTCKSRSHAKFVQLSATMSGVSEVREVVKVARTDRTMFRRDTIVFIDEIHRFNKSQQDTLLPHVEDGTIILMGATTENPSFQVNSALLSRCRVVVMEKLNEENIKQILLRALSKMGAVVTGAVPVTTDENGTRQSNATREEPLESDTCQSTAGANGCSTDVQTSFKIDQSTINVLAGLVDGDARVALNSLQMAAQAVASTNETGSCPELTMDQVKTSLQRSHILYDKTGDEHYNCISALHKSIRGSDCNAALYWLARMLEGGETPLYVARRLIRIASEDIGLADPQALALAVSTHQACHFIGMPECDVILAQCVVYQCRCPKSVEVYMAYDRVKSHVRNYHGALPGVPLHLRNAPTKLMKDLGYGRDYKYNPDYSESIQQSYLPPELIGTDFFADKT